MVLLAFPQLDESACSIELLQITRTYERLWSDLRDDYDRGSQRGDWPQNVRLRHWGR